MKNKETRKPKMIIKVIQNDKVINTIKLNGKALTDRALTYLSGAYGEVIDKNFQIIDNHSTTFTFKVLPNGYTNCVFDTTIENFDLFLK